MLSTCLRAQCWRWFRALLILALVPMLSRCDGAVGSGVSTETGNPPVLEGSLVRLEARVEGAVIVGEPGSVPPGVDVVTAVELRTGETATAPVRPDGSFEIRVSAEQGIYYVVAGEISGPAEARMRAANDPLSVITVGGTSVRQTAESLGLVCYAEQLEAEARIGAALESLPQACDEDAECELVLWQDPCSNQCGLRAANAAGVEELRALLDELPRTTCPSVAAGDCPAATSEELSCDSPGYEARCEVGACSIHDTQLAKRCGGPSVWLRWSRLPVGGGASQYEFSGQAYYGLTREDADSGTRCVTTLYPCSEESPDTADADMRRAVAAPEVQRLLDDGGVTLPASGDQPRLEVDVYVRGGPIRLSFPTCAECGASAALLELSEVLRQVELAHDPCAECLSPVSNLQTVDELELGGCGCDDVGVEVCAEQVPLRCAEAGWTHTKASSVCD